MAERLLNAIQVVNVETGMSYIRHSQCVSADEVITAMQVHYPAARATPYSCDACKKEIPLTPPQTRHGEPRAFGL